MIGSQLERQHGAHREAGHEQVIHLVAVLLGSRFHAGVPVAPAGIEQVVDIAAVSRQLHAIDAVARAVEPLAEQTHLGGSTGQAMNKQHTAAAAFKAELDVLDHSEAPVQRAECGKWRGRRMGTLQ